MKATDMLLLATQQQIAVLSVQLAQIELILAKQWGRTKEIEEARDRLEQCERLSNSIEDKLEEMTE